MMDRVGGRLYRQIYLGFVGIAVFCLLSAFLLARVFGERPMKPPPPLAAGLSLLVEPMAELPESELSTALSDLAFSLRSDLTVYGRDGKKLAASDPRRGPASISATEFGWIYTDGDMGVASPLRSGKTVVAWRHEHPEPSWFGRFGRWMALFLVLVAIGCFPLARWLTRRLEHLQHTVDQWGGGDLTVRATPLGRDEVAQLATSFNRAADRIEHLIQAQRLLLAKTSHEFRTPLSRIRMALQLLEDNANNPLLERYFKSISQDTEELDSMVGDILLLSRLQSRVEASPSEVVDLFVIANDEGAHFGANLTGRRSEIIGNSRLLRRLVRNLVDNAFRYSSGHDVDVSVDHDGTNATLEVRDRGPGITADERERVFEPFYRGAHIEDTTRGTGLGLTVVRDIAQFHRGSVQVSEREGGGSVFSVRFPLAR